MTIDEEIQDIIDRMIVNHWKYEIDGYGRVSFIKNGVKVCSPDKKDCNHSTVDVAKFLTSVSEVIL